MFICVLYLMGALIAMYGAYCSIKNVKAKIPAPDYLITACGQGALALFLLAKGLSYIIYNGVFA